MPYGATDAPRINRLRPWVSLTPFITPLPHAFDTPNADFAIRSCRRDLLSHSATRAAYPTPSRGQSSESAQRPRTCDARSRAFRARFLSGVNCGEYTGIGSRL